MVRSSLLLEQVVLIYHHLPGMPEGQDQGRVIDVGLPLLGRLPVQVPARCRGWSGGRRPAPLLSLGWKFVNVTDKEISET